MAAPMDVDKQPNNASKKGPGQLELPWVRDRCPSWYQYNKLLLLLCML